VTDGEPCGGDCAPGGLGHLADAAIEFGWWCRSDGPDREVPVAADTPGAQPDLRRVWNAATWDPASHRWHLTDTSDPVVPLSRDHGDPDPAASWADVDDEDDDQEADDEAETAGGWTPPIAPTPTTPRGRRRRPRPLAEAGDNLDTDDDETRHGELIRAPRILPARRRDDDAAEGERERRDLAGWWQVLIGDWPHMITTRQPSLQDLVRYATDGAWCAPDSWLRWPGQLYCVLAVILSAVLYGAAWLVQRPARLAGADSGQAQFPR